VQRSSADLKIDPSVLAAEIDRSEELQYLYKKAEEKLGELKKMHLNSLYWIKEYLNFPVESIIMLLEYCARIEKTDFRYIESIAISWHDKDIITFKQVEEEIARLTKEHTFTSEIRSLFELKRSPTTKQKSYIDLWQNAGYPMELIKYAYEISVENIEKADFKYINTILLGWAENGIRDLAGAQKLREQPRQGAKKARAPQPASQEELDKMNKYLSLVNRFKEDDTNE
jgi:DnaD/phage-associated family protein